MYMRYRLSVNEYLSKVLDNRRKQKSPHVYLHCEKKVQFMVNHWQV